jgi:hypothetical protein
MLRNLSNLLRVTRPGQVALEQRCRALHSLRDNAQGLIQHHIFALRFMLQPFAK